MVHSCHALSSPTIEPAAVAIMRQLLGAVAYMHRRGVAHRDIKPQNVILDASSPTPTIRLADFNVSKVFSCIHKMSTHTGTAAYSAPEMLSGEEYT